MVHFLLEIGLQFAPPTLTKSQPGGPAANGRPAPTRWLKVSLEGLRPMVGLRRPARQRQAARRRRPTPGAKRLKRPISIG